MHVYVSSFVAFSLIGFACVEANKFFFIRPFFSDNRKEKKDGRKLSSVKKKHNMEGDMTGARGGDRYFQDDVSDLPGLKASWSST